MSEIAQTAIANILSLMSPRQRYLYLLNLRYGEHRCSGAKLRCCSLEMCEPCFVQHLKKEHSEHSAMFWYKLSQSSTIMWRGNDRNAPLKNGTSKTTPRKSRKEKQAKTIDAMIIDEFKDAQTPEERIAIALRIAESMKKRWKI